MANKGYYVGFCKGDGNTLEVWAVPDVDLWPCYLWMVVGFRAVTLTYLRKKETRAALVAACNKQYGTHYTRANVFAANASDPVTRDPAARW